MKSNIENATKLFNEGANLLRSGNAAQALECFLNILAHNPNHPILSLYIGTTLHDLCRYSDAIELYQSALQNFPNFGELYNNLGNSLMAVGRFSEASDNFKKSADILNNSPVPLAALATALQSMGDIIPSEMACRRALDIDPLFAPAHWNLSLNLLLQGRYEEGWIEYEWRWKKSDFTSPTRHEFLPLWDGAFLNGKSILLHAEQGFGDAIQFSRYVPLVVQKGGQVFLECHSQLESLLKTIKGVVKVFAFGAVKRTFDYQAPLLTLPRIFGTTLRTIPSQCPYLSVEAEYREKWSTLIPERPGKTLIGLVWAGNSYPDPLRSCGLEALAPFAMLNDVEFHSIQVGVGAEQLIAKPIDVVIKSHEGQIINFSDTAALIERLDIVVSIDTAVAHLSGSLGKLTFLMLPFAPDWRWLLERGDSPWYPSVKIFRQLRSGDWGGVVCNICKEIQAIQKQKTFEQGHRIDGNKKYFNFY